MNNQEPALDLPAERATISVLPAHPTRRKASGGLFFGSFLRSEPHAKRAIAFFDGQNPYHSARAAFGYSYPNYDVQALADAICRMSGWELLQTRFYTGVPDPADNRFWNRFWLEKLRAMGRKGARVFSRPLRYQKKTITIPNGESYSFLAGEEKGIDVRIALDVVRMAHRQEYDVALLFSQDQDLSEVADDIRAISREQNRWIKIASAFPSSPFSRNKRGIDKTDWIPIDRQTYDSCLDRRDYRG